MSSKNKSTRCNIKYVFYQFGHVILINNMMVSCPSANTKELLSGWWVSKESFIPHDNVFREIPYTHNLKYYYIIKNGVDNISKL